METEFALSNGLGELVFTGDLTIDQAAEFKAELLKSLALAQRITVNLDNVTAADLSCLQLLCAMYRSCGEADKELIVQSQDSELFKQLLHDAGYCRTTKCPLNPTAECMWQGGLSNG